MTIPTFHGRVHRMFPDPVPSVSPEMETLAEQLLLSTETSAALRTLRQWPEPSVTRYVLVAHPPQPLPDGQSLICLTLMSQYTRGGESCHYWLANLAVTANPGSDVSELAEQLEEQLRSYQPDEDELELHREWSAQYAPEELGPCEL